MSDPKSLERAGKGVIPCTRVDDAVLRREWFDCVRGHVGTAIAVRWNVVRSATNVDLPLLYEAGKSAAEVAAQIVRRWKEIKTAERNQIDG